MVVVAGSVLTRYADALGAAMGLGRALSGLLLLGVATSLPELAIACSSALIPSPNLAVGDPLGSCLFNLLILAVLDLIYRSAGPVFSRKAAGHALSGVSCILLTAIVLLAIVVPTPWRLWRLGIGPLAVLVAYGLCLRLIFHDQRLRLHEAAALPAPSQGGEAPMSTARAATGYVLATIAILIAAPFLASRANELAEVTGLGATFVGTLILAMVTSLPEVSTTRAAVKKGSIDLAVGNILGSNLFNILILVPVDLFFGGAILSAVDRTHAITAVAVIIVTSIAILGMLYRVEKRILLLEPDAAMMILTIMAAYVLIYLMRA